MRVAGLGLVLVLVGLAVFIARREGSAPARPTVSGNEFPLLLDVQHSQGSLDLVRVNGDGSVTGWLGDHGNAEPVGCRVDPDLLHDLEQAAAAGLEPGAEEPERDGYDYDQLEVTGPRGSAWQGDGGNPTIVVLALRLVHDMHAPPSQRAWCLPTEQTTPGHLPDGVVLLGRGQFPPRDESLFVSATGLVTGRTMAGVLTCRVPAALVEQLRTAPIPRAAPPVTASEPQFTVRRDGTTHELATRSGVDPLSTAVIALLDDVQRPEAGRTLCAPP